MTYYKLLCCGVPRRQKFRSSQNIMIIIIITKTYKAPLTGAQRRRTIQCR